MSEPKTYRWQGWHITIWLDKYDLYQFIASKGTNYRDGTVIARNMGMAFWQVVVKL